MRTADQSKRVLKSRLRYAPGDKRACSAPNRRPAHQAQRAERMLPLLSGETSKAIVPFSRHYRARVLVTCCIGLPGI